MSTETVTPEIVADDSKEMLAIAKANGLTPDTSQPLQQSFAPFFAQARQVMEQSRLIVVTDASQKLQVKLAREYRLALRAVRIAADKTRKDLKEDSDRKSKAIQGFYNIFLHLTEPEEQRLEEQEKTAERLEAARKAALVALREAELRGFDADPSIYDLGNMSDALYADLLSNTRIVRQAKAEAARKAEEERIRVENERLKEEARMREENERLKREAAEKEAALRAERERVAEEMRIAAEAVKVERARIAAEQQAAAALAKAEREKMEALVAAEQKKAAAIEQKRRQEQEEFAESVRKQQAAAEEARKQELAALDLQRAKERKEAEAKAKAAKDIADAKTRDERIARERAEAELKAHREAADRLMAEQAEAKRRAMAAPDKDRLLTYANAIRAMEVPALSSLNALDLGHMIEAKRESFALWVEEKAGAL